MKKSVLITISIILIIAGVGAAYFLLSGNGQYTYQTIERGTFETVVKASGKVAPITEANLGFQSSGTIENIYVDVGDAVEEGDLLLEQDPSSLQADLASAEANARIAGNDFDNAQINLVNVISKQNSLVASARAKLLSEGLVAEARDGSYTQTAPTISGRYSGTQEGTYKIVINRDSSKLNSIKINVFDLEEARDIPVSKTSPTPLGAQGLFISFPDSDTSYANTVWYVDLPNKESSNYIANLNAYQEALEERENAIQTAEQQLRFEDENISIAEAERLQAQAQIEQIQVQLSQSKITAPFDGTVTLQEGQIGEVTQAGEVIVSMIGAEGLKLEVFIPEVNIAGIEPGQQADVVLDAYGPHEIFKAEVISIDPTETLRDGISTYKTTFYFETDDARIRSGMTADVTITTDERDDVLLLPRRALIEEDGKQYVLVADNEDIVRTEIQTGMNDSYGNTEILSGIEEGARVVINPDRS